MPERMAQLYFVRGWPIKAICERYGCGKSTVRKLISEWKIRAVAAGYIQEIDPEALLKLASEEDAGHTEAAEHFSPVLDFKAMEASWGMALPSRAARAVPDAVHT